MEGKVKGRGEGLNKGEAGKKGKEASGREGVETATILLCRTVT